MTRTAQQHTLELDAPRMDQTRSPTFIDMFCGCGGLSVGFKSAGYQLLLGIDHDEPSLKTYSKNFGADRTSLIDLYDEEFCTQIAKAVGKQGIDVVIAGPPCQGFSLTGTRNFDDRRNQLYLAVIKAISRFKPRAFLIENVKGMKTLYGGSVLQEVVSRLNTLGYQVTTPRVLCAADYGVPQVRERLFIVGVRQECPPFEFPLPTTAEDAYVTCEQAISDLQARNDELGVEKDAYIGEATSEYQARMRAGSSVLWNHVATRHTDLVKSVISLVPEGQNYKSLPPGVGTSRTFNEAWTRYHSQKPSRTIDTGHRNHFHYKWNRVPTIRENARLQSFPDTFVFEGTKTQQNRQVGNAVPPLLAEALARHLLKSIT